MMMKRIIFNLSIILIYLFQNCCSKNTLIVAGLFHENDTETEMAFRYAIARQNMFHNDIFFKTKVQLVPENDTFSTLKTLCEMLQEDMGLVAVFGPFAPKTTKMVESITSNFEIPHIQISWSPHRFFSNSTVLNLYPDPVLLSEGLAVLVRHMDWKNYAIVYENNDGLMRLQEALKLSGTIKRMVTVKQLGSGSDHRTLLKELNNATIKNIILDCETDKILNILQQAKEVKMLEYVHSYLLTSLDAHTLDYGVLNTRANLTTLRIIDPDSSALHHAVRDWEVGELNQNKFVRISPHKVKTETALMYDAVNLLTAAIPELQLTQHITTEPANCEDVKKWAQGLGVASYMKVRTLFNTITGPIKFDDSGRRVNFSLEIVQIISGRVEKNAYWRPDMKDKLKFLRSTKEQMQQILENLQQATVIVSSRIGPPYLVRRIAEPGEILEGNAQFEGYSMDLIAEIARELNFTFKFIVSPENKYGNFDEATQSWTGIIGDLLSRRADLGICDLTITRERRSVVDFSMPFMNLGVSILYRKGSKQDLGIFAFMDPLDFEVWVYTATLYLAISISIYFIARMAPGDWENPHPCDEDPEELENIWDLKNCMWLTMGSIMTQGCDILPKGISSRMGASMWWFFSLIMTSSYTANLAAFLTMERMGPSIDSAEALAKQTKIKYGTVDGGSTQKFFKESNYSTFSRMWMQMETAKPTVFEKSNAEGVKRVLTTKNNLYAFLMESSSIDYEIERDCDLRQVGSKLDSKGYGIAMPTDAPYRGAINKAVLKLQEDGKLNVLKAKWWKSGPDVQRCDDDAASGDSTAAELALANVGGVFLVLGVGVAIALLLAIVDFLWNVRNVSVEEHMTYWEALKVEAKFATNVWITKKRVKPKLSESAESTPSSASTAPSGSKDNEIEANNKK